MQLSAFCNWKHWNDVPDKKWHINYIIIIIIIIVICAETDRVNSIILFALSDNKIQDAYLKSIYCYDRGLNLDKLPDLKILEACS